MIRPVLVAYFSKQKMQRKMVTQTLVKDTSEKRGLSSLSSSPHVSSMSGIGLSDLSSKLDATADNSNYNDNDNFNVWLNSQSFCDLHSIMLPSLRMSNQINRQRLDDSCAVRTTLPLQIRHFSFYHNPQRAFSSRRLVSISQDAEALIFSGSFEVACTHVRPSTPKSCKYPLGAGEPVLQDNWVVSGTCDTRWLCEGVRWLAEGVRSKMNEGLCIRYQNKVGVFVRTLSLLLTLAFDGLVAAECCKVGRGGRRGVFFVHPKAPRGRTP